ncbi:MAG: CubicO group peptidase (beta-lactamase class C family) [Arcticibacterium sp.]|jgi:CubicO group peptidase (beta-lactamase class C family)
MKHLILPFLFLFFVSCVKEDIPEIKDTDSFVQYIESEIADMHIPALSLLVFKENKILYENYFGQSNIENQVKLAENHLFLLASISKVITATALLQLYDDGLLALDDPINNYLPFEVKIPSQNKPITFRMLLTHTSGIADGDALDGQYYFGKDSPVALKDFLKDYLVKGRQYYNARQNFHDFEPGTQHEYSNIGNALIGYLVEEVSGKNFNQYCKENIFNPLEMTHTHWRLDEIQETIVTPYNYKKNSYQAIEHYTFTDYPNGGLRSTSKDLFKFLRAFVQNGESNGFTLLKASTISEIIKPQIPTIDAEVGLHMFLMNKKQNLWGHDGGEEGVATIMALNPDTKVGVIVLSNQGDADLEGILEQAYLLSINL